mmetsp:Transcript_93927/g.166200  ORF Transcript_93927/g.166200 Transcript_93927/m.166200 type:complete len:927 (-) Transcript_93927:63-2843(-)
MFSQLWGLSERQPPTRQQPAAQPSTASAAASRNRSCIADCLGNREREGGPGLSVPIEDALQEAPQEDASDYYGSSSPSTDRLHTRRSHDSLTPIAQDLKEQYDEDEGSEDDDDNMDDDRSSNSEKEYNKKMEECRKKLKKSMKKVQDEMVNNPEATDEDHYIMEVSVKHQDASKSRRLNELTKPEHGALVEAMSGAFASDFEHKPQLKRSDTTATSASTSPEKGLQKSHTTMSLTSGTTQATHLEKTHAENNTEGVDIDVLDGDDEEEIKNYYDKVWVPANRPGDQPGLPTQVQRLRAKMKRDGTDMPYEDFEDNTGGSTKQREFTVTFDILKSRDAKPVSKTVTFKRRPLGLKWHRWTPVEIFIVMPNSHAAELGVRKGWILRKINGQSYDGAPYTVVREAIWEETRKLPSEAELNHGEGRGSHQAMTQKVNVIFEAVKNIPPEMAEGCKFWCTCEIPGKPHSRFQTPPDPPNGFPKKPTLPIPSWQRESFNIFDYDAGDPLIFKLYSQSTTVTSSVDGHPETLIGMVYVANESFCPRGQHKEHTVWDRVLRQPVQHNIKLQVRIDVKDVSIKKQVIDDYWLLMRDKFEKLFADDSAFKEMSGADVDPALAVRYALEQYHRLSQESSRYYPFPGKQSEQFLDQERLEKLRSFKKFLNTQEAECGEMTVQYQGDKDPKRPFKFIQSKDMPAERKEDQDSAVNDQSAVEWVEDVPELVVGKTYEVIMNFHTTGEYPTRLYEGCTGILVKLNADGSGVFNFQPEVAEKVEIEATHMAYIAHKTVLVDEEEEIAHVKIVFQSSSALGSTEAEKVFTHRPLEMEYKTKKVPLTIERVTKRGYAEEKGVLKGWTIQKIDGEDVHEKPYKEVDKLLQEKIGGLPVLGADDMAAKTPVGQNMLSKGLLPTRQRSFGERLQRTFASRIQNHKSV